MHASNNAIIRWLCVLLFVTIVGCGGYEQASSESYEYAKALYSITNRKAADRLPVISKAMATSLGDGKLTNREFGWLTDIVRDAEDGKWKAANQAARQLMEAQTH